MPRTEIGLMNLDFMNFKISVFIVWLTGYFGSCLLQGRGWSHALELDHVLDPDRQT